VGRQFSRQFHLVQGGFDWLKMDSEDGGPAFDVWYGNVNLSVESAWPEQSRVKDVRPVGGRNNHNIGFVGGKA
jgi:hypothetical protein